MKVSALFLILVLGLLIPSYAPASVCPQVEPIGNIGGGEFEPMRVAVDGKGNVYVTDRFNKNFKIFDRDGRLLNKIDIASPLGVTVDGNGKIYLGRAEDRRGSYTGEVRVYDSNLNLLFSLGKGWGEFKYPSAIATDATRVYVADGRANVVKAYDIADGKLLFSFGGYGYATSGTYQAITGCTKYRASTGGGYLVSPTGIYVHPVTGNLYITDRALFTCDDSTWGMGAGVHVFTRDGVFIKKFGEFNLLNDTANQVGRMILPANVVIDGANRVIVSDYSNGYLHVFADDGAPICLIEQGTNFPQGLEFGADGRLLIASLGSVVERGIDDYVRMSVEPESLSFDTSKCVSSAGKNLTITNGGPGVLNWSVASDKAWLSTEGTASGSINGKASVSVPIKIDLNSLIVGKHKGALTVSSQGVEETVSVIVEVRSLPELKVSPLSVALNASGLNAPQANLNVEVGGSGGSGGWTASADSDGAWLGVSPSAGPSGALSIASVTAEAESLSSGSYNGSITVSAACATGSPVTVPVTLSYLKGATINVASNIEAANYTVSGPSVHSGSGTSYTLTGLGGGSYTITFGPVAGRKTPLTQTITMVDGETKSVYGDYVGIGKKNNVIATMGSGQWFVADELRVYDAGGLQKGSITLSAPALLDRERSRSGETLKSGAVTAAGDMDGDGKDDFIVANDRGIISGFKADGTPIAGLYFTAFPYRSAVDVAVGDVDGDKSPEIIVGAGATAGNPASIRVFEFKGGVVTDTGLNFLAYEELYGVNVAVGDVDGDSADEIITAPGGGSGALSVRVWKVQASGGAWTVADAGAFNAGLSLAGADVAAGDIDADGVAEVIVATVPSAKTGSVKALRADGSVALDIPISTAGAPDIAAGDTDLDGRAEIVVGERAADSLSTVRIYGPDGALKNEFKAFDSIDIHGVKVSLGRMAD